MTARRIGLAGLGSIAAYYLAALDTSPDWELAALCDVDAAALRPHRDRVPCFTDHRVMLAEAALDALVVAVPNHAHAPVCRDALRAGVPVCVEKPLALTVAEGRELAALAHRTQTALFTAFHRRYNEAVHRLRGQLPATRHIASVRVRYLERIEEHIGADTWYLDPARCGGGCVADNGPNAFDLVRLLLGEVAVTRSVVTRDARGVDRQAVIGLRARSGAATARVELDWSHPGETKDIEVRLTDGTVLSCDMLALHAGFKASLWHEYVGILAGFAAATGSTGSRTDGGLAALELVAAAYRCEEPPVPAAEGGRPR
ncbi:Gfo/Idh/MocA family oxidoreductase [Streptomyces albus subsp. chlorinus]|uniref:Gfo/Idh/MocA family protein n=1 Tax=Streptomyces albus TaxID=1888 RepID=UPI00156DBF0C|nr:Gfo/Idh/MocA family oxidoreductase [Streptomyces albus]NSC24379.1 Gfo/Idh/MocA family oxidoreductase [Streptomyces albus subsp. chlorinus]